MPHIHEKVDFCVEVFIVHENRLLLRIHDKYHKWLSVGGHIELDEDPSQAAVREVREEAGLSITLYDRRASQPPLSAEYKDIIPPMFVNRHRINATHEHVAFVYFATSASNDVRQGETEISDQVRWFSKEELEKSQEISEDIKWYGIEALNALSTR